MKFIRRGVKKNDQHRDDRFAPTPGAGIPSDGFADRAPKQNCEHRVFGEMRAFADDVMNGLDMRLRHVRKQPVQERFDEPRGVRVGLGIAGAKENQGHPREWDEPIF